MNAREEAFRAMARDVIALMQGGDLFDVSPERTETIIAGALAAVAANESAGCAAVVLADGASDLHQEIARLIRARGAS